MFRAGGKNASLGEMYRSLQPAGVRVSNGFATTADAYRYFMGTSGLDSAVAKLVHDLRRGAGVLGALVDAGVLARREGVYRRHFPRPNVQSAA